MKWHVCVYEKVVLSGCFTELFNLCNDLFFFFKTRFNLYNVRVKLSLSPDTENQIATQFSTNVVMCVYI